MGIELINQKIKEIYNNDMALFYKKLDWAYKNGARKFRSQENKIEDLNEFLSHLNLEIEIKEKL